MKKILALALALCMLFALCACGAEEAAETVETVEEAVEEAVAAAETEEAVVEEAAAAASADDIDDTMTSADGTYEVAFVTDVGQLKDKSFNQGCWDGVKLYAYENGLSYKYYQPANGDQATDDDRYDAMKAACDAGAKVVVCAGFMQEAALTQAATDYPDVDFIFIDGYPVGCDNVAGIAYQEEQAGYLAGYAIVKEGYTKLGYSGGGGGTNPACCRYGYGFVQGANDAAAEMGVEVEMNFTWQYGASFSASPELAALIGGWYENGTEVVFSCGGSIFQSITQAAAENDALVIGVDVDQSSESDTVITSAMKGLSASVVWALEKVYAGEFADIGGVGTSLGAADDSVGLPVDTWQLENWSVEEYEALFAAIVAGEVEIDADAPTEGGIADVEFSNVTVNYV